MERRVKAKTCCMMIGMQNVNIVSRSYRAKEWTLLSFVHYKYTTKSENQKSKGGKYHQFGTIKTHKNHVKKCSSLRISKQSWPLIMQ